MLSRNVEQKLLIYIAGFRIQLETLNLRLQRMQTGVGSGRRGVGRGRDDVVDLHDVQTREPLCLRPHRIPLQYQGKRHGYVLELVKGEFWRVCLAFAHQRAR